MSGFWFAAAALIATLVWMLRPARSGIVVQSAMASSPTSSLGLLKSEWARLDTELAGGQLSADEHRLACDELQRRVLAEAPHAGVTTHPGHARKTWLATSLVVPLFALLLYGSLGNLAAIGPQGTAPAAPAANEIATATEEEPANAVAAMVDTLARRLATEPALAQDVSAWTMLARAYAGMRRFADASGAYARAIALTPNDVQLLADQADVLAMLQGGRMAGEPQQLIDRALRIDPGNLKALALAGSAAFERKDTAAAIAYWQQARQRAPAGSAFASGLDRSLAAVQSQSSQSQSPTQSASLLQSASQSQSQSDSAAAPPATRLAKVSGHASLAPALASRIAPGDTVFITARAVDGPRMPLAVLRRTAADLPLDFQLDDSMAMSPEATLSSYPRVVVSVRVSRSGNAMPQSGDLFGQASADASSAGKLAISIDSVQP